MSESEPSREHMEKVAERLGTDVETARALAGLGESEDAIQPKFPTRSFCWLVPVRGSPDQAILVAAPTVEAARLIVDTWAAPASPKNWIPLSGGFGAPTAVNVDPPGGVEGVRIATFEPGRIIGSARATAPELEVDCTPLLETFDFVSEEQHEERMELQRDLAPSEAEEEDP